MIENGMCDMITLVPKKDLPIWSEKVGPTSLVGSRSFAPVDESLSSVAQKYFGLELTALPSYILVAQTVSGHWKMVLDDLDLVDGPLVDQKLKEICSR